MATRLFEAAADDVLYIVDISGYVFRAFHAIAPLSSPLGEPTNAILGTVNMLERLIRERQPRHLAIAMDSRTATFRKELYPAYKANRPPPPDELRSQMRRVGEVVEALSLPVFQQDGVEADDVIATLVGSAAALGLRVVIVSGDKDLMQLVSEDVVLWDTMRDRVFGPEEVTARFGVGPSQVRDALALIGDTSDNVPGVPSVGPKTAAQLLSTYGDLAGLYAHLTELKRKKLRETLEEHRAQAELSQQLVTLRHDVPLEFSTEKLRYQRQPNPRLRELYAELGFMRQLAMLDDTTDATGAGLPTEQAGRPLPAPILVGNAEALAPIAELARASGRLSVVPILLGSTALTSTVVGVGLAPDAQHAYYAPTGHRYLGVPTQLAESEVLVWLHELLQAGVELGGYDVKSLLVLLGRTGRSLKQVGFDARITGYVLGKGEQATLERMAQAELGLSLQSEEDLTKVEKKRTRMALDEVAIDALGALAGARSTVVFELWQRHMNRLDDEGLMPVWRQLEQPLIPLLAELEQRGICLDASALRHLGVEVEKQLSSLEKKAHALAGREFNVNSPRQLETLLFDELGLKPLKRTKTSRSTDAETLEALSEVHELPAVILELRQLSKLKGTYIDTLPKLVDSKTGRLHTIWHQDGAATGRLSSSEPNLQNIPIRSELGSSIRSAFIAQEGHVLISADYSQIELRVLAHLSEDPVLLDAFSNDQDIHLRTAMEIFEVDAEDVDEDLRRQAKAVNFGVIYGQGDSALAKSLGISRAEAGQFIAAYFRRYSGVRTFMDQTLEKARAGGVVSTLMGRQRSVPDINNANRARRLAAERIAMNTPIQGTAADLIKLAMLHLQTPVTEHTRMLLTVHDELVFEVPELEANAATARIRELMEGVFPLRVPLAVDVGIAKNWRAAH